MSFAETLATIKEISLAMIRGLHGHARSCTIDLLYAVEVGEVPAEHLDTIRDCGCFLLMALSPSRMDMDTAMSRLQFIHDLVEAGAVTTPEVVDLTMDIEEDTDLLCPEVLRMLDEKSDVTVEDDKDSDYCSYGYMCITCSKAECNCNDILSLPPASPPASPSYSTGLLADDDLMTPPVISLFK